MFELKFFIFPQSLHRITSIRPVSSFEIPSYSSFISEPGSVVGIVTGYGLDGPGIESRWGARFSAPVQTGPGAHPASCTIGTGSFPWGKERPGRDADPSPPSSAVVKKD